MAKQHPSQTAAQASAPAGLTPDQMQAELDRLSAENAALRGANKVDPTSVSFKVSEKGGLSVYGMGRFPVTLYREQWQKLLDRADEIRKFIADHDAELKRKEPKA